MKFKALILIIPGIVAIYFSNILSHSANNESSHNKTSKAHSENDNSEDVNKFRGTYEIKKSKEDSDKHIDTASDKNDFFDELPDDPKYLPENNYNRYHDEGYTKKAMLKISESKIRKNNRTFTENDLSSTDNNERYESTNEIPQDYRQLPSLTRLNNADQNFNFSGSKQKEIIYTPLTSNGKRVPHAKFIIMDHAENVILESRTDNDGRIHSVIHHTDNSILYIKVLSMGFIDEKIKLEIN